MFEISQGGRRRLVIGVVLAAVLSVLGSAPAEALHRGTPRVSISRSAATVLTGDIVRVSGRASGVRAGRPVLLQRASRRGWVTVRRGALTRVRGFAFSLRPADGRWEYRALVPASYGFTAGDSRSVLVRVLGCHTGPAPTTRTEARFSSPHRTGVAALSRRLGELFCAAAPGAKIDIAMYFIRALGDSDDVQSILTPLKRIALYRHVHVRVLLEGRLYRRGGSLYRSLASLRSFAQVILCEQGCHNERFETKSSGSSTMHHKFLTISDTRWRSAVTPVVVSSSANWSASQLHQWQSALIVYDDPALAREFDIQFETMVACASPGHCASWGQRLVALGLSAASYGMTAVDGLWADHPAAERFGTPGRGTSVYFSPRLRGDALAQELQSYTCTPAHHTVRVGHMFVTASRRPVLEALALLRTRGCTVSMVLSTPNNETTKDGIRLSRQLGLAPTCLAGLHDKIVSVDAVRMASGVPDLSLWTGSQSLGGHALHSNDETMLRLSTATATGLAVRQNAAAFAGYQQHLVNIKAASSSCHVE